MNHMDRYLAELQKKIPDIEGRLNAGAGEEQFEQLARKAGCGLSCGTAGAVSAV